MRQEPFENLISFICSTNNNIARITQMLNKLSARYGNQLGEVEGIPFHSFPTVTELSAATELELRAMGFGYRARYVSLVLCVWMSG